VADTVEVVAVSVPPEYNGEWWLVDSGLPVSQAHKDRVLDGALRELGIVTKVEQSEPRPAKRRWFHVKRRKGRMSNEDNGQVEGLVLPTAATHRFDSNNGWAETVTREALEAAVAVTPRVPLTLNYGGLPIGYADLSVDDDGLKATATIDLGISYRVLQQTWDDRQENRRITGLSLDRGEVSILITPAAEPRQEKP
jgi:hypothetical protein